MRREHTLSKNYTSEDADSLRKELKLGYINLEDGLFDLAQMNFEIVLRSCEDCADAYFGLMLCKLQLANENELSRNPTKYKNAISLAECEKALKFADENQKNIYNTLLEQIYKINEGDNY